jgi:hypothetical protein
MTFHHIIDKQQILNNIERNKNDHSEGTETTMHYPSQQALGAMKQCSNASILV